MAKMITEVLGSDQGSKHARHPRKSPSVTWLCFAGLLHRPTPTTDTLGIVAALNWQAQQTLPQWGPGGPPSDGNGMPVRVLLRP